MSHALIGYAGIAMEAVHGTAASAPSFYLPLRAATVDDAARVAVVVPHGLGAPIQRAASFLPQLRVDFEPQPDGLGLVLSALLGAPTTTLVSSGVWQHVFEGRTRKRSVTLEVAMDTVAFRAAGAQFDSLALSVRPGGRMQASANGVARSAVVVSPVSGQGYGYIGYGTGGYGASGAFYLSEEAPTWQNVSLVVSAAGAGAQEVTLTALQVGISRPTMALDGHGAGGRVAAFLPGGPPAARLGFSVLPPTSAWISYGPRLVDLGCSVNAKGSVMGTSSGYGYGGYGYGKYGEGANYYLIAVDCPSVRMLESPFTVGLGSPEMSGGAGAFASVAATRAVKVTLINVTSGY